MNFFKKINDLSEKDKSTRYYIGIYTISFTLLCLVVYSSFLVFDKSFLWSFRAGDGLSQHYPALTYIGVWGREIIGNFLKGDFTVPVWDLNIGYGADAITTFHYYGLGDPLTLLSIIVPAEYTEYLYNFLVILRLFLSGISFILYCKKMNQDLSMSVLGSFIYIFCGYALFAGVRHPFFLTPMIYFPLVLLGCEKIFKKENPLLFIISVAISILSNFYFSYMLIVLTVIYVVIRFVYMEQQCFFKELFVLISKFFGFGVIALMISAILLLPIIIVFMGNSRSEVSNNLPILYNIDYYQNLFFSFIEYKSIGYWNFSAYTPISLIAVFYIFTKKAQYKPLKTAFIVSLILQVFPVFGYMLNGFAYVSNRFIWAEAFLVAFIAVYTFKDIINSSKEEKIKLILVSSIYTIVFFILPKTKNAANLLQIVLLFAILLVLIFGNLLFKRNVQKYSYVSIAIISVVSISINGVLCYSPAFNNYVAEFQDSGTGFNTISTSASSTFKDKINYTDTKFHRYESSAVDSNKINQNLFNQTAGHSYFFSLSNDKISPYLCEMEIPISNNFSYRDLNSRVFLNTLTSTKYYITKNQKRVPYNYQLVDKIDKYSLYENPSALPLGYTYNGYITRDEYQKLTAVEKQEAIIQNVLLETSPEGFKQNQYTLTSKEIPYEIEHDDNIVKYDNGIYVKENEAVMKLKFKGIEKCETYLCFSNLNVLPISNETKRLVKEAQNIIDNNSINSKLLLTYFSTTDQVNISVKANGISSVMKYRTPQNSFYSEIHDFTTNLGYSNKAIKSCSITFPTTGFYSWDDIKIICQPMDNYQSYIENLSNDVLENLKLADNKIYGNIVLEQDKVLCISVPYSNGWTCYVNGTETEILQANTWCMAIPLTAGEHDIRLEYSTPGLKVGTAITVVGIISTLAIFIFHSKRKKDEQIV